MNESDKNLIIKGAAVVGILTVFVFIARSIVKKTKAKFEAKRAKELALSLGTEQTSQEAQEAQAAASYNPSNDYTRIFNWIDGANWQSRGTEVNSIINRLTDSQLIKLAKYWEKKQGGESLYYWLDWEAGNAYATSENRLKSLGYS